MLSLSTFRCETESRIDHPCAWRCWTHDCGDAHEEHHQSCQERAAVSTRADPPHGCCVLMGQRKPPPSARHRPFILKVEQPDELPLHMDWTFYWHLSEHHIQPFSVCYICSCSWLFHVTIFIICDLLLWVFKEAWEIVSIYCYRDAIF